MDVDADADVRLLHTADLEVRLLHLVDVDGCQTVTGIIKNGMIIYQS